MCSVGVPRKCPEGEGGKSSWVNLKLRRCVTCFTSCFVFSLQGGGLQKWKPLTQTPEPQRYNIPHLSLILFLDFLNFSLLLCLHMNSFTVASSSEKWFRASSLISEWLVVVQTGGSLIKAIVKGGHKYSLSLTPTDRCTVTVRLHVTSTCSCIQRKSCAASGGVLLCSLVKDAEKHRH